MSQKELAQKTKREDGEPISPQFLNDIERDRRRPGTFILNALAEQLKLNADELHLIAGQLPPDVVERGADADRMKRVMEAFRRAYKR
jgi:transcriptional regulator with XRE-family HTH domain